MRYDSEHKLKTRERVLAVAANAIRSQGPHRVGVAAVMSEAGLTHGGFYAHFASKDELITAAIDHMFIDARARIDHHVYGDKPPAQALTAYIDFYLSARHRDAMGKGCPVAALAADVPRLGAASRERFSAGVTALSERIAAPLAQLGYADAAALSRSVLAELLGTLAIARSEPDGARSDAILADARGLLKRRLGLDDACLDDNKKGAQR
ncbi:Transcriptional regulator, TetR family [Lysobacter capsici AZ78]|uniref:Transcriptional regulator, TetR family n=1 Tax=Lysobacter capsici AZ78 TaxID=1444315 RepID=A0A108UDH3_9GAMM|nr:TetR/AcrR family transcriptional regulator [Lysobacter capsici]KWS07213.1 Transcriptional regulator, TetR family [Lysobacter capsici AZ78]